MKPLKLTMNAFGSYGKETVIDFTTVDHGLFLITGDTGAGKTTIFDGITFAIYGETSGGKRDGRMMQSQFASPSDETFVELTFSYRDEVYTVRRSPEYMREKKRGSGLMKAAATVELTMPDGTVFRGKVKETDKKLCEIMGIDREQFTQIAMIAQGEFLRLLHAKSEDRKKIFSTIFHTGVYRKVEEELGEKRKELKEKIGGTGERMRAHVQGIRVPELVEYRENEEDGQGNSLDAIKQATEKLNAIGRDENPDLIVVHEILELFRAIVAGELERLAEPLRKAEEGYHVRLEKRGLAKTTNDLLDALERAKQRLETGKALEAERCKERLRIEEAEKAFGVRVFEERRNQAYQMLAAAETRWSESKELVSVCREKLAEVCDGMLSAENIKQLCYGKYDRQEFSAYISEWKSQQKILEQAEKQKRELEKASAQLERDEKRLATKQEKMNQNLRVLTDARNIYGMLQERFLSEQAGILASERLRPGEPCPVCGSLEHPAPAVLSDNAVTEADVKRAQEIWEQKRAECEGQSLELREEAARIREIRKQVESAEKEIPKGMEEQKERLRNMILAAENYANIVEQSEQLFDEVERCKEILSQAGNEYQSALSEVGFTEENYRKAGSIWKTRRELDTKKKENEAYFTELRNVITTVETLTEQARDKVYVDLFALDRELTNWKAKIDGFAAQRERLSSLRQNYEQTSKLLEREAKQYTLLLDEFLLYDGLWQAAGGKIKGQVRMDFETYVQRIYFEKILAAANKRFLVFTNGKMKLKSRPMDEMTLVGAAGLDINVYVMATGKERDVKTLSGGESFLASLALALGLSDVVQSQAGSIRLESMFVDEGFGALDDHTREQAMRVLNDLAGDDRLVGIISHVNALKDSIERKLIVTRGNHGSSVNWSEQ